jgi:hypothetical protein
VGWDYPAGVRDRDFDLPEPEEDDEDEDQPELTPGEEAEGRAKYRAFVARFRAEVAEAKAVRAAAL